MANLASFDITSGVDLQEVDNAVNQANKEIAQRYDFKGSKASIDFNKAENSITLTADNDFKMTAYALLVGDTVDIEIRALLPDPARGTGFWFATVNRSRSDGLSGFTGRMIRGRVRSEVEKGILAAMKSTKQLLERAR